MTLSHAGVLDAKRMSSPYVTSIALGLVACLIVSGYCCVEEYNSHYMRPSRWTDIEYQSAVCDKVVNASITGGFYWTIMMTLNNTGTRDTTLKSAFINETRARRYGVNYAVNGTEVDDYGVNYAVDNSYVTNMTTATFIPMGTVICVAFYLSTQHPVFDLTSGTTICVEISCYGGMDYREFIELV
jgi:hypothetical protein